MRQRCAVPALLLATLAVVASAANPYAAYEKEWGERCSMGGMEDAIGMPNLQPADPQLATCYVSVLPGGDFMMPACAACSGSNLTGLCGGGARVPPAGNCDSHKMTPAYCAAMCHESGFELAGLSNGVACFCGPLFTHTSGDTPGGREAAAKQVALTQCRGGSYSYKGASLAASPCPGAPNSFCGGKGRMMVYETECVRRWGWGFLRACMWIVLVYIALGMLYNAKIAGAKLCSVEALPNGEFWEWFWRLAWDGCHFFQLRCAAVCGRAGGGGGGLPCGRGRKAYEGVHAGAPAVSAGGAETVI